ncbi:MAG: zinc ribbon domain-containing protein [Paludibacteraceae bacterium]|nr:zinc ribbon domain-containing protein [Paludibacteraceae bacterium]
MYCKHCGKKISEDSKYCKYCGGIQSDDLSTKDNDEENKTYEISVLNFNIASRMKTWRWIYAVWTVINLLCLYLSGCWKNGLYIYDFYPFVREHKTAYIYYYDFSEFIVYVFLIPLLIYKIIDWKYNSEESNKEKIKQNE